MTPVMAALWFLLALVPAWLGLGIALALRPTRARPVHLVAVVLAALSLLAGLAAPLAADTAMLVLPVGPPGLKLSLRLDPLAGVLLVLVCLPALAGSFFALDGAEADAVPEFPVATGLAILALLGAGAFAFMMVTMPLALLLARVRSWPAPLAALALAGMPALALHALLRLPPEATPPWTGAALLLPGAAAALAGGIRAGHGATPRAVAVALSGVQLGLVLCGIGLSILARGADLGPLAALAGTAAVLHALHHAVLATLLLLAGATLARGAGTSVMDRMGGLVAPMPVSGFALLLAAFASALLPPGPGFASAWMLFQALFAAPRAGGLVLGALLGVVAAILALAIALGGAALLRLAGATVLGRPRTPRAAAAQEAAGAARALLVVLIVVVTLLGLLPGAVAMLLAPATGLALGPVRALAPGAEAAGYIAPVAAAILLVAVAAFRLLLRRRAAPGQRWAATWNDGFAAPPPWLPFGEPEIQLSATAHAAALAPPMFRWWESPRPSRAWVRLRRAATKALALMPDAAAPAAMARHAAAAILAVLVAALIALAAGA